MLDGAFDAAKLAQRLPALMVGDGGSLAPGVCDPPLIVVPAQAVAQFRRAAIDALAVAAEATIPLNGGLSARFVVFRDGSGGAPINFDVRYFELAPGGRTNFEQHRHAHVVIGLRGSGRVRLGRRWVRLRRHDTCYVAPETPHELHNDRRTPFGFLCIVDAARDRGRPVQLKRRG